MDQDDADIFLSEIVKITGAAAKQVVDFAGGFSAAETGADNNESEMPFLALRILAHLGPFHLFHDVRAKGRGVTDAFEREGMVGHSGNDIEVGGAAARDDDVIV